MAKLLVVEQDSEQRESFRQMLEGAAHRVIEASTATEAVEACAQEHPDLVLLDPHLGRFLGMTKGKWVAEQTHACGSAPVVVVAEDEDRSELDELGPDAVVSRDAGPEELLQTVANLLE